MGHRSWLGIVVFAGVVAGIAAVVLHDGEPADEPAPDRVGESFAKVHFMKKFVAALSTEPDNRFVAPAYAPLLRDGASIACADCHDPADLDLDAMLAADPGARAVEPLRSDRDGFMVPLMEAWVKRLNRRHRAKLRRTVACTDCHAWDPRDEEEAERVLPALMASFVRALTEPPRNRNPSANWRPLLKETGTGSMLCARCHGERGVAMERDLEGLVDHDAARPYAADKGFMTHLMERWVTRLNRELAGELRKAVVCIDCHDRDPRR